MTDDDDTFTCDDCGETWEWDECADPDQHDGKALCGWCADEWEGNR